ncbi:unnamed protein product, partial [Protopolystoma xenopodis]
PEPTPSSQAALSNCVVVARAASIIADIWLPPSTSRLLRLAEVFTVLLVLRDDLTRVFKALTRATGLLCTAIYGLDLLAETSSCSESTCIISRHHLPMGAGFGLQLFKWLGVRSKEFLPPDYRQQLINPLFGFFILSLAAKQAHSTLR